MAGERLSAFVTPAVVDSPAERKTSSSPPETGRQISRSTVASPLVPACVDQLEREPSLGAVYVLPPLGGADSMRSTVGQPTVELEMYPRVVDAPLGVAEPRTRIPPASAAQRPSRQKQLNQMWSRALARRLER